MASQKENSSTCTWPNCCFLKGDNTGAKNNDGQTTLHCASYYGHAKVAKLLLLKEANIKANDNDGDTPLHCADNADVTKLVFLNGEKREAKNNIKGWTPLHVAGNADVSKLMWPDCCLSKGPPSNLGKMMDQQQCIRLAIRAMPM